jgi:hypothetical protein
MLKVDDIKKNMWITFLKHKPQQIIIGFSQENNKAIQVDAPMSRTGLGIPYYVWSISLPYIVVSSIVNGHVTYFPIDTRESEFSKLERHYVMSFFGKDDYRKILDHDKNKNGNSKKEEPVLSSAWMKTDPSVMLGNTSTGSFYKSNDNANLNEDNSNSDILNGLRNPENPNTDWTVYVDPIDNLPPDNQDTGDLPPDSEIK